MEPLITNERAAKEWRYIVNRVSEQVALNAIKKLPGRQRPYPLNIAKVLRITLPTEDKLPMNEEEKQSQDKVAEENLTQLKKMVKYW